MMPAEERVRRLERTVGELRERNRQLEEALRPAVELPKEWLLKRQEAEIFAVLLTRDLITIEQFQTAILDRYGRPASVISIYSQISRLRKKAAHHNVTINSSRNLGWSLKNRRKWRATLGLEASIKKRTAEEPS